MKKFVLAVMLLAGLTTFAQEKAPLKEGGRPKKEKVTPEQQAKQVAQELNLNDSQQKKIKELYTDQEKQRANFKPTEKPGEKHDHAAMQAQMKKENDAFEVKMKNILTADQYTKWKAADKKQGGHGKHDGKPGAEKKS